MAASQELSKMRFLYRLCYGIGTICTAMTLALLAWVAFCIAIEAEPLASLSFLPDMPVWGIFALLAIVLISSIFSWQKGAAFHQRYEKLQQQSLRHE